LDYLTTHTSLSPIRHGFAPAFVNYKKGYTRLAATSDKVYQLLAHGQWFFPGTPASSTTKICQRSLYKRMTFGQRSLYKSMTFGQRSLYKSMTFGQRGLYKRLTFGQRSLYKRKKIIKMLSVVI
jgi:hypothetical protein